MTMPLRARLLAALALCLASCAAGADTGYDIARENAVTWNQPGKDENDSMPIGNGDLAANVWTEANGDLVLLLAKSDAWDGTGDLLKLGRVRIHFSAAPFAAGRFTQTLRIADGSIVVADGASSIRVWADANAPALHTEIHLARPAGVQASVELWRGDADTVLPPQPGRLAWYHRNEASVYPDIMAREHLDALLPGRPDPYLHRTFGAALAGAGMTARDGRHLDTGAPQRDVRIDVVALTQAGSASAAAWSTALDGLLPRANPVALDAAWTAHAAWWRAFWDRSWIRVTGNEQARAVTQGYAMQRYMMAACSRGAYPVKFNGGLFTVGRDVAAGTRPTPAQHDPDYRRWGDNYWNQNNRLLYWPLLASGDADLLAPWFKMYADALPLAAARTRLYYGHDGAALPETMYFWGIPRLADFGRDNPTNTIQSSWQRYHIQGGIEVAAQMLDAWQYDGDARFAAATLVPFADAIVTYYDLHWPRDKNGKIQMAPAQSLETYQLVAVNPTPDIAGLASILPRMLALPASLVTEAQRRRWTKILADLPPIPIGTATAQGKTPPFGAGAADGTPIILPAERYGKTGNGENPELYVAFPYRLYGVGKPDLALARATFAARRAPQDTCWGQDGTQAAVLGLTDVAQKAAIAEFTNYGDQRFQWFWKPAHDWIPDLDDGGSGMITLQLMLVRADDRRIQLLPAWPADWSADFKLHAPYGTTVSGHVEHGRLATLDVMPKERRQDVAPSEPANHF